MPAVASLVTLASSYLPCDSANMMDMFSKPLMRRLFILGLMGVVLIVSAPWWVACSPLRNQVVGHVMSDPRLNVTAASASMGWSSMLELEDVEIESVNRALYISIDSLQFAQAWPMLWWSKPDLGITKVTRPQVEYILSAGKFPLPETQSGKSILTATMEDAGICIRSVPEAAPLLEFTDMQLDLRIEQQGEQRMLIVEPATLIDRKALDSEMCRRGLQLIAPGLANATEVDGEITLKLNRLRLPLDVEQGDSLGRVNMAGRLIFHEVNASIRQSPIWTIAKGVAQFLQREIPETIQVVDDSIVDFYVRDRRVHHQGFAFVLPDLSRDLTVQTSGWVGLDETLDLEVSVALPFDNFLGIPLADELSARPIRLRVSGKMEKPSVKLADGQSLLAQLSKALLSNDTSLPDDNPAGTSSVDLAGSILQLLNAAKNKRVDSDQSVETPLLDLFRERRRQYQSDLRSLSQPDEADTAD